MSATNKILIVLNAVDQASSVFENVTQGLATLRDNLLGTADATQEINRVGSALDALTTTLIASAGAMSLAGIAALSDDYANMSARLRLVTDGATEFAEAQEHVSRVAEETSSALTATGDLYTVLQRSLDSLGDSTTNVADLTATITRAMTLSGASAAASAGALTQLSQALASGVLRGDEFNSIMEQAPRLAQAIADSLGVTTGQLRGMAEQGLLTAQVVIDALREQSAAIAAEAATLPDTFGRAMERIKNAMTEVIGRISEAADASGLFGRAVDGLVGIIHTLGDILETLAGILGRVLSLFADLPGPVQALVLAWVAMQVTGTSLFDILGAILGALGSLVISIASGVLAWIGFLTTVKLVGAALSALWGLMLANPVTALIAVVGLAVGAFYLFRDSAEETAAALREQQTAIRDQVQEVRALTDAMSAAATGSDAYNTAARRLAEIVPGLSLSLSEQGTMVARLGERYAGNTAKLSAWRAEQEQATRALLAQELAIAAQQWREASKAVDDHARRLRESYGATEESRTGMQSLTVALARWGERLQTDNQQALALNKTLAEQGSEFRALALAALDSTGTVSGVADALRRAGANKETIAAVTAELQRMLTVSNDALDGLTDAERRAAEVGMGAARALADTIEDVDKTIAELDTRIAAHAKTLDVALKAEAAGWKALGEAARGTYTEAIAEVDRYTQARLDALQRSLLDERATAQEREAIARASALAREFIERDAASAKLAALNDYQRTALRLLDDEARRRLEVARATGGDVRAVEMEILKTKRDTLRQIESDYRRHIDGLNSEARRHLDEVKRIEDEIRGLKMSTEDRIRELQRGAMSDFDAYNDARKQAAEKNAEAERAIAASNFELAKQLSDQAGELYARNARAIQDVDGNEIISKQQAATASVKGYTESALIGERALEGMADAARRQADTATQSAQEAEQALASVAAEADRTADALDREISLKLNADTASVDALVETIRPLIEERGYLLKMRADLDTVRTALADAATYAADNPIPVEITLGAAEALVNKLKDHLATLGDQAMPIHIDTDPALAAIKQVNSSLKNIRDTDATLTILPNDREVRRVIRELQKDTSSKHTIYIKKVETNALGGLVGRYAAGGHVYPEPPWSVVPGSGNTDSVRAGLRPGSFVLRKSATRYYGELLQRLASGGLVPSLLMPGERLFAPGTVARWGQGLFEALNAMTIPREQLAAALAGFGAPVARFAAGGSVGSSTAGLSATRDTVDINLRVNNTAVRLVGARDQASALAGALRELARGG